MFEVQAMDHVAVIVEDRERAADWYQQVFGMERRYADVWTGRGDPTLVCKNGVCIALFQVSASDIPRAHHRNEHFALKVDHANFERARGELGARGIAFSVRDHTVCHSLYLTDPDGNHIDLTTYET